jgi:hypothetical protein
MSIGLSGTAGDISTMLFGSVSGGLSAELTGGNFWQGAATGLAVSALNHVAHRMMVKSIVNARIDGQFDGTGMNPDDVVPNTRDELLTEATRVKESLPELVRLDTEANFPGIELGRENTINLTTKSIVLKHMANPYTYRQLAITIGHELVHMTHYVLGYRPSGWLKRAGGTNTQARNYSEYLAYKWELHWGGNINYGAPESPSWYKSHHLSLSGNLPKIFGY